MAKPAPSRLYPSPIVQTVGNFAGVTDSPVPMAADQQRLYRSLNCYVTTGLGSRVVKGRPGFTVMEDTLSGTPATQWIGQFTLIDGTSTTIGIAGGELYSYDHGLDAWTKEIDSTDLSGASITLSTTARCYCCVFANELIVSDGTNTPFSWDGTSGSGLTKLTNCPVIYGQPVVYYYKLFVIKNSEQDTIVWSEEGTPNTGYEAGGYNNAWTLGGTKNERIIALAARNDSLGIIRPRSTTTILGAVNDSFQTTGTRAAVSENIGTSSPGAVLVLDEGTVVLDSDCRPQFWPSGGGYAERPAMWNDCETTVNAVPKNAFGTAQIVYDSITNLILIGMGDSSSTTQNQLLVFERTGGVPNFVGVWNGFPIHVMGMVQDAQGQPLLAHGTSGGAFYLHGTPDDGPWLDGLVAGDTAISHEVIGPTMIYDADEDCRFSEATVAFYESDETDVSIDYETSQGSSASTLDFTLAVAGVGGIWDQDNWDGANWAASGSGEFRQRVGLRGWGRWIRLRVVHNESNKRIGIELMRITASRQGRWPNAA